MFTFGDCQHSAGEYSSKFEIQPQVAFHLKLPGTWKFQLLSTSLSCFFYSDYHWLTHTVPWLLKRHFLALFPVPLTQPPLPPPSFKFEAAGSIVIGLQSWQPYDCAVGYCNWIRLEINSVPVRLLKSQSAVHGCASIHSLLHHCQWTPYCSKEVQMSAWAIVTVTCLSSDHEKPNQTEGRYV